LTRARAQIRRAGALAVAKAVAAAAELRLLALDANEISEAGLDALKVARPGFALAKHTLPSGCRVCLREACTWQAACLNLLGRALATTQGRRWNSDSDNVDELYVKYTAQSSP